MKKLAPARIEKAVDKHMLELLSPLGFVKGPDGGAFREQRDVYQYIAVVVQNIGGVNRITPFGQIGFKETNQVYNAAMYPNELPKNSTADIQIDYCYFTKEWRSYLPCQTDEELPGLLVQITDFLVNRMLPCLETYSDPKKVLAAYIAKDEQDIHSCDPPRWKGYGTALQGLILARLYGNGTEYASLKSRYARFIDPLMPHLKDSADKLIAYLDAYQPNSSRAG